MVPARDRLNALLAPANTTLNGIDFVEVATKDERTLRVHFLNTVALTGTVSGTRITGGESIPEVSVDPIDDAADWSFDTDDRPVLTLTVAAPGDFSFYRLTLDSPKLDRFFTSATFTFKADCPATVDCEAPGPWCPPEPADHPSIDYLAKDFLSFRKVLSDFSNLRYPNWHERSEADLGVMLMEVLSAVADDLSYVQDRVAAEAALDTATERRSIVRHARLVDYEPRPATSARTLLRFWVSGGPMPTGVVASAQAPDGTPVEFETGTSIDDHRSYPVDAAWNELTPYWWDDSTACLDAGATEVWVVGHGLQLFEGQAILIDTAGPTSADPHRCAVVHLASSTPAKNDYAAEVVDPLFTDAGGNPVRVTRLRWRDDERLDAGHDLTRTVLSGNLVPAIQGRRHAESFAILTAPAGASVPLAVVRDGPTSDPGATPPTYSFTLGHGALAWRGDGGPQSLPVPELVMSRAPRPPATVATPWTWRRRLLDAEPFEEAFTIDSSRLSPVRDAAGNVLVSEYDGTGDTIRFGDGTFGEIPDAGDAFSVLYRVGLGRAGNVPARTIRSLDPSAPSFVTAVDNPLPASGGADPETDEQVRRRAPQAFRAKQYRAVRRQDYEAAAQTLPWVDRAGTKFRWTGSWFTVFTTADSKSSEMIAVEQQSELAELLNRYRMTGYESYVPAPRYVPVDLVVELCARPEVFRADVHDAVVAALRPPGPFPGAKGFFHPDNFTFGTPLERSRLDAAVQAVAGVHGVVSVTYRRRGITRQYQELADTLPIGSDQILQVDDDPSRPEAGSLRVVVGGGK